MGRRHINGDVLPGVGGGEGGYGTVELHALRHDPL